MPAADQAGHVHCNQHHGHQEGNAHEQQELLDERRDTFNELGIPLDFLSQNTNSAGFE